MRLTCTHNNVTALPVNMRPSSHTHDPHLGPILNFAHNVDLPGLRLRMVQSSALAEIAAGRPRSVAGWPIMINRQDLRVPAGPGGCIFPPVPAHPEGARFMEKATDPTWESQEN